MRKQDWSTREPVKPPNAFAAFAKKHGITLSSRRVDSNPSMIAINDSWADTASHYRVTLRRGAKSMSTYFSMGSAHTSPPTIPDILESLALDAGGVTDDTSFESWAGEYGFDIDSRKAYQIFQNTKKAAKQLKNVLGEELLKDLIYNIDSYGER